MVDVCFEGIEEFPGVNSDFLFSWYKNVCSVEHKVLGAVTVVLCSDDYLLEMNKQYLQHDYYTDIITFDYTEEDVVSGDLFVSVDRVRENAVDLNLVFEEELHRVCVHGLLHLCGYKDKSEADELLMRSKEDEMLRLRVFHVEHLKP